MASARQGQVSVHVDAPAERVWSVVADLDRMGEWSPECYRVTWLDGARSPARPGARFKGRNRWGPVRWSMTCEVKTSDPGREVSWSTLHGDREVVRWTYRLEPDGTGTTVTESFDVRWLPPSARLFEDALMVNRDRQREAAMRATLERIKAAAEAPA
ncbi:MAG TPA: SRPBCC family protein [Acidimicrobiales bacterium]|nr:SRPBCC family protein [Acidimicrobiales bacterium]